MQPSSPQTLNQLMRAGNRFTDRHFMKILGVGHPALKQLEVNPGKFTMGQLMALAFLLGQPLELLVSLGLEEAGSNPETKERLAIAMQTVQVRKLEGGGRKRKS